MGILRAVRHDFRVTDNPDRTRKWGNVRIGDKPLATASILGDHARDDSNRGSVQLPAGSLRCVLRPVKASLA